jgi:hypothetical protein
MKNLNIKIQVRRKNMRAKFILVSLLTILVVVQLGFAGSKDRAGTSGAVELLLPVGARGVALGGSNLATTTGVEAIYWNPAGLSMMKSSVTTMFSHMSYIADMGVEYIAVGTNFAGFGTVGLSLKSVSFGDISNTTNEAIDGIGTYSPAFYTIGITYAKELTNNIRIGATINFLSETIQRTSATGIALNAGIQYYGIGNIKGLKMGLALKNLGPDMKFDGSDLYRTASASDLLRGPQLYKIGTAPFGLPSSLEMGLAYEYMVGEDHEVSISGTFQNNNYSDDEYKLGFEYAYKDLVYLRGGYVFAPQVENSEDFIYGPSFGVGAHYFVGVDVTAEYAYRWTRFFDSNQVITLTLGF